MGAEDQQKRKKKKNGEGLGAFITWMMSGGWEVEIEGWGQTAKTTHCIIHSLGLQTLAWSKRPIMTNKKLAFEFSEYIYLNISPAPYIHLASTWCHSCNECSKTFPVFCLSSAPVYYCEHKRKIETGEAWERGYKLCATLYHNHPDILVVFPVLSQHIIYSKHHTVSLQLVLASALEI